MSNGQRHCAECGKPLAPRKTKTGQQAKFCDGACRAAFNNRRASRGAELYDYFMAARYERKTHSVCLGIMSQMAAHFREDDDKVREGRKSWVTPDLSGDPRAFELDVKRRLGAEA